MKKLKRISAALMVILLAGLYCSHCTCNNRRPGQSADGSYFLYRVYFRIVLCYGTDDTGVKKR